MIVRSAGDEDVPAVLELWSLARSPHALTPDRAQDIERLVREMPGSLLVAEDGERLVGALIAAWDGWRGNMYRLAVHPDHRRHGIALSLVEEGERLTRSTTSIVRAIDTVVARLAALQTPDQIIEVLR